MFDMIVNGHRNTTRRDVGPLVISWAVHTLVVGVVVFLPLLFAADHLPAAPKGLLTSVTVVAPSPPPAPPPPASTPTTAVKPPSPRPASAPRPAPQAPVVAPPEITPFIELAADTEGAIDFNGPYGVAGGVLGGVPGGVIGGVIGGMADVTLPPPPPAPREAVRTGGQIQAPALVKRVPPVYPPIAVNAKVQGVVILEATVGLDGRVEAVEVLRSIPLLDTAAIEAVRQWVYEPLLLNGRAQRFVLTATVSFSLS